MKSQSFTDFDAFAESVGDVDAVMMFQNPKSRSWTINHVYLPEIHVQLGRLGSGNIVEGQSWSNGYLLYLPLSDNCEYLANGSVVEKNSFAILEPGCDFCVATKSEHDWCTIFVPTHKFADSGDEWSSNSEKMTCRVSHPNLQLASQCRTLVHHIMTAAAEYPKFEASSAATHVEVELLKVAFEVMRQGLEGRHHQEGRPLIPRQEITKRCNQFLDEREGEPVRTDELAAVADVSRRTLQRVFHEYYGISPVRYLQLRRLHQIHGTLQAADFEEVSVTDVLFGHGVWEIGRFARRYHRLFGELPSETLGVKRG